MCCSGTTAPPKNRTEHDVKLASRILETLTSVAIAWKEFFSTLCRKKAMPLSCVHFVA
jgi:hypothetical protein